MKATSAFLMDTESFQSQPNSSPIMKPLLSDRGISIGDLKQSILQPKYNINQISPKVNPYFSRSVIIRVAQLILFTNKNFH